MKFLPVTRSETSKWRMDSPGIKNKQTKPKESGLDPCSSAEGRKHSKCHWFRMYMVLSSTSDSYTLLVHMLPKSFSQAPLPEHPKTWHQLGTKSSNTWVYETFSSKLPPESKAILGCKIMSHLKLKPPKIKTKEIS